MQLEIPLGLLLGKQLTQQVQVLWLGTLPGLLLLANLPNLLQAPLHCLHPAKPPLEMSLGLSLDRALRALQELQGLQGLQELQWLPPGQRLVKIAFCPPLEKLLKPLQVLPPRLRLATLQLEVAFGQPTGKQPKLVQDLLPGLP